MRVKILKCTDKVELTGRICQVKRHHGKTFTVYLPEGFEGWQDKNGANCWNINSEYCHIVPNLKPFEQLVETIVSELKGEPNGVQTAD